jgi:hypothetical protein
MIGDATSVPAPLPAARKPGGSLLRVLPWLFVLGLAAALAGVSAARSIKRYDELRPGWSWDLAYYNQWFWALTQGDGKITVRPIGPWVQEGPSVWTMNYLAPVRLAVAAVYRFFPGPQTLLVVQAIVFWLVVPAAFTLVRSESRSTVMAISAAALVPLTPLLWPLALNDFRELQLAIPFVLWAVQGVRSRDVRLTASSAVCLLACRQEYALLVSSLAILPPREPEDIARRYRWARALWLAGLAWLLFGFLLYLRWAVNPYAWEIFLGELRGERAPIFLATRQAGLCLALGLGSWSLLALLAPRAAVLALPWLWTLCNGRWDLAWIGTELWHHVRYTSPMVATVLAAGCLGYARLFVWLSPRRDRWVLLISAWVLAAIGLRAADFTLESWFARVPRPISAAEAVELWKWIDQVDPNDGVIAQYEMSAPLSSRQLLFSYGMTQHRPRGYPQLAPEITWLFYRKEDIDPAQFTDQGFRIVHDGPHALVLHRERQAPAPSSPESPSPSPKRLVGQGANNWEEALGNFYLVLGDLLRTALFLAPGVGLLLWSRRRRSLTALIPDEESPRSKLHNALVFTLMFGASAGAMIMAAGIAYFSWTPLQFGSILFSASLAVTLPLLYKLRGTTIS